MLARPRQVFPPALPFGILFSIGVHNWYPDIFPPGLGYFLIFAVGTCYAGILQLGRASFPVSGPIRFTMDVSDGVKAGRVLNPRTIIPAHYEGWTHFSQGRAVIEKGFANAGLQQRLCWLKMGETTRVEI